MKNLEFPSILQMRKLKPGEVKWPVQGNMRKNHHWALLIPSNWGRLFCNVYEYEMLSISCNPCWVTQENFILAIHRTPYKYRIVQKVSSAPVEILFCPMEIIILEQDDMFKRFRKILPIHQLYLLADTTSEEILNYSRPFPLFIFSSCPHLYLGANMCSLHQYFQAVGYNPLVGNEVNWMGH